MKFKSVVWRGNKMGAGFVRIPKNYYNHFKVGESAKVKILDEETTSVFYSTISNYKEYRGFYIPQGICIGRKLLGKLVKVEVKKLEGFHSRLMSDGRLYIPKAVAEKFNLKENDLIVIKGNVNGKNLERICKTCLRKRRNKVEYFCIFSRDYSGLEGVFQVKRKLTKGKLSSILKFVLTNVNYGKLDKERIIVFFTKKKPIVISSKLKINNDLVYYLGCYFADGTKRGGNWGIVASTFEQANFYLKMHKRLILNPDLHSYISVTSKKPVDKDELIKKWKGKCLIEIENVRVRRTDKHPRKINPYGSLILKEYAQSIQLFYRRLLEYTIQKIVKEKNRKLALNFFCGVLEGDGSPSSYPPGSILVASNKNDVKILEKMLEICGLKFWKEKISNKISIRVNALTILKEIEILSKKIFKYYPSRRKKLVERLCKVGAVRFILGKQDYCSYWVRIWLRNNGILDKNYELTSRGLRIKNCLFRMIDETKGGKIE